MSKAEGRSEPQATGHLEVIPLGGMGEIGKNMFAYRFGDEIMVGDGGLASRNGVSRRRGNALRLNAQLVRGSGKGMRTRAGPGQRVEDQREDEQRVEAAIVRAGDHRGHTNTPDRSDAAANRHKKGDRATLCARPQDHAGEVFRVYTE